MYTNFVYVSTYKLLYIYMHNAHCVYRILQVMISHFKLSYYKVYIVLYYQRKLAAARFEKGTAQ